MNKISILKETNIKDNGLYKIVASNIYGQVTSSCRLNVEEDITDQDLTIIDNIDDEIDKSGKTLLQYLLVFLSEFVRIEIPKK